MSRSEGITGTKERKKYEPVKTDEASEIPEVLDEDFVLGMIGDHLQRCSEGPNDHHI